MGITYLQEIWQSNFVPFDENSFAICLLSFVEASSRIIIWGFRCWIFLPLQTFKFSIHHMIPSLVRFFSVTWSPSDPFYCRANISSCWRYQNWIRAGTIAWTVDGNRPIKFLRFKTEVFGCAKITWHCWGTCFTFFLKEPKSFSLYLLVSPETLNVSQGEGLILWGWSQNLNVAIEKIMCRSPWEVLVMSFPLATYHPGK